MYACVCGGVKQIVAVAGLSLLVVGQCIGQPLHCLVEAIALDGGCFEYLKCATFQCIQAKLSMHLGHR